jgi:hypothetical protein
MRVRCGVNGVVHVPRRRIGGIWIPWVRVDLEISESQRGYLSGEEAQVVVDYVEVLEGI